MVAVKLNSQDASACFGISAGNARQIKRRVLEKLQNFCDQNGEEFDDLKALCEQLKERSH
jgi:DNA-directed RNA polymerase specialized sigma24 family protein